MESLTDGMALIGRSGVVRDAAACLRDESRSGAIVVGGVGSGKTAVIREVLREVQPRGAVIRLAPTPMLSAVPFGVLAPYLDSLPAHDLDSAAAISRAVTARLKAEPIPPLFVVDDAHSLDRGTVQLVAQAVATGAARLLAACSPGPSMPEEFLALWDDGLIAKYDLPPLTRSEIHQFCEQALRAEASPWVSELFGKVTAGNPYMLKSLVEYARKTGVIAPRKGTWYLISPPVLSKVPAADLVDHRVRSMPAEEQSVAAIVSLAGPLSLGQVLQFSNPKTVDALEMAGIITVSRDQDRTVRPASPLVGEILRDRVPAGRSASLRASLLALPGAGTAHPEAFLNRFRWALDCGALLSPAELLQAATAANAALDTATARRAGSAVPDGPLLPEARVQLAYSDYLLGRRETAASHLSSARSLEYGRPAILAALLAARLRVAAPAVGPPAGAASPRDANADPACRLWTESAAPGLALSLLAARDEGAGPDFSERLHELVDEATGIAEIQVPAISRLAELQSAQGRVVAALEADRHAWPDAPDATRWLPLVYEDVLANHCLNLIRAGEWDELASTVDDYAAGLPSRLLYGGGLLHLMRGYSRVRQGRFPESLAELLLAVEELAIADPWNMGPFAHALAAYAAATVGRQDEAEENARAFRSAPLRDPETLRLLADAYCTAAELSFHSVEDTSERLEQLAELARGEGLRGVETEILRLALRNGDTTAAQALEGSTSAVEGHEGQLLRIYARGVAASDTAALTAVSDEAMNAGYLLLALEAAQQAARCLENDPHKWRLTVVQRKVHHRMVAAGMSESINIVHGGQQADLTAREAEILKLVARGASNMEIATALTLSTRTVEGHLYRIFGKLGVSRRSELVDIGLEDDPPPS
ncbi:LuxR family transcriptional regulator [Arthrobacter sp. B3I4]|uniref:helix-turn-helix transcriptional regulator n=1 Tax=Arthrobacter sp. B3I4 TaxID=3042267 RepID=UPI0027857BFE|nr:LuxR family transcriptional regulator [Arthrobacter sp. B3I4]MDQ0757137.1 DNA-binding CsgD family transcriptional regulator [Arthrobacter sp. B3I4]